MFTWYFESSFIVTFGIYRFRRFYMPDLLLVLFLFNLSLFLLHEMDAIRRSEWRLFIVLKDMEDSKAYKVFTFIHLFLYVIILSLLFSQYQTITFWVQLFIQWGFLMLYIFFLIIFQFVTSIMMWLFYWYLKRVV
ncbi:DUF6713 family protein [Lysinibacillus irui]|nr:DUF6713 family protein [Lysinibacillus irui]MEA0553347.1 DUF6713 family protein [Lysinibacillus irui]